MFDFFINQINAVFNFKKIKNYHITQKIEQCFLIAVNKSSLSFKNQKPRQENHRNHINFSYFGRVESYLNTEHHLQQWTRYGCSICRCSMQKEEISNSERSKVKYVEILVRLCMWRTQLYCPYVFVSWWGVGNFLAAIVFARGVKQLGWLVLWSENLGDYFCKDHVQGGYISEGAQVSHTTHQQRTVQKIFQLHVFTRELLYCEYRL